MDLTASLLSMEIELQKASMEIDYATYQAKTFMDNTHNFYEVLSSLQKHASTECMVYASELLGIQGLEEWTKQEIETFKSQQAKKKVSIGEKLSQAINNWWGKFKYFLGWLSNKLGKFISAIGRALRLTKKPIEGKVDASFDEYSLKVIVDSCKDGKSTIPKVDKKNHKIDVKDAPEYMSNLKEVTDAIAETVKTIDDEKKTNPKSAEKKMMDMKQNGAAWAQAISQELTKMGKEMREDMEQIASSVNKIDKNNPGFKEDFLKALDA